MAIAYEQFQGEVGISEDDIISSASDDTIQSLERADTQLVIQSYPAVATETSPVRDEGQEREHISPSSQELLTNRWPKGIGSFHILMGVILLLLGVCQLLVIPLIEDESFGYWRPSLDHTNCYGACFWLSLLMLLSGTFGLRSAIYRNTCNLYTFVTVMMVEMMAFPCFLVLNLVAYSSHWISREAFSAGSAMFPLSISVSVAMGVGFTLVLLAFIQYFDEVFCGELQLCRRCIHFCIPCWCPRAISQEELLVESDSRPPSLPV